MGKFRLSGHMRAIINHKDAEKRVSEFLQVVNGKKEVDYWATTECSGRAEIENVDRLSVISFEVISDEGITSNEIVSLVNDTLAKGLSYETHTVDGRMTSVNSIGLQIWENPTIEIFEIGDDGVLLEMAVNPYGYVINFQEQ